MAQFYRTVNSLLLTICLLVLFLGGCDRPSSTLETIQSKIEQFSRSREARMVVDAPISKGEVLLIVAPGTFDRALSESLGERRISSQAATEVSNFMSLKETYCIFILKNGRIISHKWLDNLVRSEKSIVYVDGSGSTKIRLRRTDDARPIEIDIEH